MRKYKRGSTIGSVDMLIWAEKEKRLVWIDGWKIQVRNPVILLNMPVNVVWAFIQSSKIALAEKI